MKTIYVSSLGSVLLLICVLVASVAATHNDHDASKQKHAHDHSLSTPVDFMNYLDQLEAAMEKRFHAMNDAFDRAMEQAHALIEHHPPQGNGKGHHYSKSVTRSFNAEGKCGEEIVVERDSDRGQEIRTTTRRIGDRSIQHIDAKNLTTGETKTKILRHKMLAADDGKFEEEWAKLEKTFMPAARGLLHSGHEHHHAAAAQLATRPSEHVQAVGEKQCGARIHQETADAGQCKKH